VLRKNREEGIIVVKVTTRITVFWYPCKNKKNKNGEEKQVDSCSKIHIIQSIILLSFHLYIFKFASFLFSTFS